MTKAMPCRLLAVFSPNRSRDHFSIRSLTPQPAKLLTKETWFCDQVPAPSRRYVVRSSTLRMYRCSRFELQVSISICLGSTTDFSIIQDSEMCLRKGLTNLGSRPCLRIRRVVCSFPSVSTYRSIVSAASTCEAYGLGYRLKKARETVEKSWLS